MDASGGAQVAPRRSWCRLARDCHARARAGQSFAGSQLRTITGSELFAGKQGERESPPQLFASKQILTAPGSELLAGKQDRRRSPFAAACRQAGLKAAPLRRCLPTSRIEGSPLRRCLPTSRIEGSPLRRCLPTSRIEGSHLRNFLFRRGRGRTSSVNPERRPFCVSKTTRLGCTRFTLCISPWRRRKISCTARH